MRVLVDTHVWLWMRSAPSRLSARTRKLLVDPATDVLLSAATPWEIGIKVALGKLRLPCDVEEYVATRSADTRVTHVPIHYLHAIESARLPLHHRDPFDRVIIAQARLEAVPVVTADPLFDPYDVETIAS